jgi:hypothetical protein
MILTLAIFLVPLAIVILIPAWPIRRNPFSTQPKTKQK